MIRKSSLTILALGALIPLALSGCGSSDSSDDSTDFGSANPYPNFHGAELHGEKNFASLINHYPQAKSEPVPWAGYWWPFSANGIAAGGSGGSPAGKYDAARGRQSEAQSWEVGYHGSRVKGIQQWWGHCNGWCAAAALYPEPHDNVTVNGITFTVADQKALLSEAGMSASADFYGTRVDYGNDYNTPKYYDTVPAQYFLVLTNYIGKLKQAVLIDRYTGDQIWNQPLAGYKIEYPKPSDYLGNTPDAPNVYRINVTSTIWWMRDDVSAGAQTSPFTYDENEYVQSRVLTMELWLDGPVVFDADGKITSSGDVIVTRSGDYFVGGAWKMGDGYFNDAWPDYMWVPYSLVKPTDPNDDFANYYVDIEWIKKHLLVPGGADDGTASPRPVEPAPIPCPTPSGTPSPIPLPTPTYTHTPGPAPVPTVTSTPGPGPTHTSPPPAPVPPPAPNPAPTGHH